MNATHIDEHREASHELPLVVLYHAGCNDGFGAAWAVSRYLQPGIATYIPVTYGDPIPQEAKTAKEVIIVDFSYSRSELEDLNRCVGKLTVIDHHKTAQDELEGLPYAYFDMEKSGAVMAWEYFMEGPVPELLLYVQDRDLWQWKLEDSRAINESLSVLVDRDFGEWSFLADNWKNEKFQMANNGEVLLEGKKAQIDRMTANPAWLAIGEWIVPAVNSPIMQSELGEALCQRYNAPFSVTWRTRNDGSFAYSLRSREQLIPATLEGVPHGDSPMTLEAFDVGKLATTFGGGGHRQAAGFEGNVGFVFHDPPADPPEPREVSSSN